MRVFHLTSWLTKAGGGIPPVIGAMVGELVRGNHSCSVLGLRDKDSAPVLLDGQIAWACSPVVGPGAFGYSPELRRVLFEKVTSDTVIHVHGLWMYPGLLARQVAQRKSAALVISPHGMLDSWALRHSWWKKTLAGWAYENRNLREAGCVHALCVPEAQSVRAYGLKNPVCVIPNGIDLPRLDPESLSTEKVKHEKKLLLFLGRLHPKKGLVNALRAWNSFLQTANCKPANFPWQFVIAGWEQAGHQGELRRLCDELGLVYADVPVVEYLSGDLISDLCPQTSVVFTGPAFGAEKDALLRRASAFILPSFSEGLPMSVLEAWSYQLPVLMTQHCNLPEGFAANAALRIGTDVESIAEGLRELCALPTTDNGQPTISLASIGRNGRALVERQFTWPQVAAQMKEVYEWLLGGGASPGCVER